MTDPYRPTPDKPKPPAPPPPDRCSTCDRPKAAQSSVAVAKTDPEFCYSSPHSTRAGWQYDCRNHAVDWRARTLTAESSAAASARLSVQAREARDRMKAERIHLQQELEDMQLEIDALKSARPTGRLTYPRVVAHITQESSALARTHMFLRSFDIVETNRLLRLRIKELAALVPCQRCGGKVEPLRECWARPTCHACLPPPEMNEIEHSVDVDRVLRDCPPGATDLLSDAAKYGRRHVLAEAHVGRALSALRRRGLVTGDPYYRIGSPRPGWVVNLTDLGMECIRAIEVLNLKTAKVFDSSVVPGNGRTVNTTGEE